VHPLQDENPSLLHNEMAEDSTIRNLVGLINQRDSFDALEDNSSIVMLSTVLDAVINDSCRYVS
jgi:hypothetical protein